LSTPVQLFASSTRQYEFPTRFIKRANSQAASKAEDTRSRKLAPIFDPVRLQPSTRRIQGSTCPWLVVFSDGVVVKSKRWSLAFTTNAHTAWAYIVLKQKCNAGLKHQWA